MTLPGDIPYKNVFQLDGFKNLNDGSLMFSGNDSLYLLYPGSSSPSTLYSYNLTTGAFGQSMVNANLSDAALNGTFARWSNEQVVSIPATGQSYCAGVDYTGQDHVHGMTPWNIHLWPTRLKAPLVQRAPDPPGSAA